MITRVNGIRFDGLHSYYDFGMWISKTRPSYGVAKPRTNTVIVPGMDGVLDMTEANSGEVKFANRTLTFTFAKMCAVKKQEEWKALVRNALHGKSIERIVADENPDWFYSGRASVDFIPINDWKLQCVVTVDAAPYAMKMNETTVDFLSDPGETGLHTLDLASEEASGASWNTDLRLGTKEFHGGLSIPTSAIQELIIKWPVGAQNSPGPKKVYISDPDNLYQTTITAQISDCEFRIPLSDITAANVDPNKVWRLLVSGIGGCSIHAEMDANYYHVWNERKQVVPQIVMETGPYDYHTYSVQASINGELKTLTNSTTVYDDIILRSGWNDIAIPATIPSALIAFYMVFREGRL